MNRAHQQVADQVRRQLHASWPALSTWQVQVTQGNVRVGDAERDAALHALGEHFVAGRLDRAEYDERLDAALTARTRGELVRLFRDLPGGLVSAPPPSPVVRTPRRPRLPVLPLLLILVGVTVVLDAPWVILIGLGVLMLVRHWTRTSGARAPYPSGRRR